ncbi:MAG: RNA polymerase sigma factor [Thermomicrobiales bacterium]
MAEGEGQSGEQATEQGGMIDERALIGYAKAGDDAAFASLYAEYQRPITGYLRRLVGNGEIAEDLAQDTFLKAYKALGRTNDELNFRAWLYRIATNNALSYHRRQRLLQWLPFASGSREPATEARYAERVGEQELVETTLRQLKPEHASLLLMRHHQGLSLSEIATVLGVDTTVAKARLFRARHAFMRAYDEMTGEAQP